MYNIKLTDGKIITEYKHMTQANTLNLIFYITRVQTDMARLLKSSQYTMISKGKKILEIENMRV